MAVLGQDLAPIRDSISGALASLRGATDAADQASPSFASVLRSVSQPPQSGLDAGLAPLYQVGYGGTAAGGGFGGNAWQTLANAASAFGAGGGLNLDLSQAWQSIGSFGNYQAARAAAAVPDTRGTPQPGPKPSPAPSGGTGASGGPYGSHERYRASIQQYAQAQGIDPDALAAILQIETNGDPHAVSPSGARGLGQIMPGTWAGLADPGDDPFDADASIKNAAKYYAGLYRQFGDYGLAAAAYQGGPGAIVNGAARDDVSDGNLTPRGYAQRWQQNYQGIKGAAPAPQGGTYTGVGGLPSITGGSGSISQDFQVVDPTVPQSIYDYGQGSGVHGHTGLDWSVPAGTQVYMPAGLSGTVTTAGGTAYFRDEDENGAAVSPQGQGELKIHLSNGMDLILGHMRNISVPVGTALTAGQLVGLSGSATGGHVHVELRVPDSSMPNGFRIIDPRTILGG